MLFHSMNPEFDDPNVQLRKNNNLVMGRDRTDSISAFKKYEKGMPTPGNINHNQDFDSPHMSPMLTGGGMAGMPYNGMQGINPMSNHF